MSELTIAMRAAIGGALRNASEELSRRFPNEGEHLVTTMIAVGFTDMLTRSPLVGQRALAAAANDKLEGTRWRIVERAQ